MTRKKAYFCPICESQFDSFLPITEYFMSNARACGWPYSYDDNETLNDRQYNCPVCDSCDRDRLIALMIRNYLDSIKITHPFLIQFAPSASLTSFIKKNYPQALYRTSDLSMNGVDDILDITNLHIYPDNSVDFFVCSHVLEHVIDDRKALRELHRILKPGACGVLLVPIILSLTEIDEEVGPLPESERWRRFGQNDHLRLYSKSGFLERVREAKFIIHQLGANFFGSEVFERLGINQKSVLYLVQKEAVLRKKVSVVMITFNHENYIAQAIDGVLNQQVNFEYELIIGEDYSSDKTRQIVLEYASRFPSIIRPLLAPHNLGPAQNIRQCFEAAKGEYIALCEGDDYWISSDKLQRQVDLLDSDPNMAICFHNASEIFDDPSKVPYRYCPDEQKIISTIEDLFVRNFIPTCSAMFRNRLIKDLPAWCYSLKLGDWTLHLLNAQHGYIYYVNETMGVHRNHSISVWSSKGLIWQCKEILKALSALHSHFSFNQNYQRLIRECAARHTMMIVEEYRKKGDIAEAETYSALAESFKSGYFPAQTDFIDDAIVSDNNNSTLSKFEAIVEAKNKIMSQYVASNNSVGTTTLNMNIEPVHIGNSIKMPGFSCSIRVPQEGKRRLTVGDNSMIAASFAFDAPTGEVRIGDNTLIGGSSISCINGITIGNYVNIAWNCTICDHDLYPVNSGARQEDVRQQYACLKSGRDILYDRDWSKIVSKPIVICDNVWIGINCIIMKGVTIGEGAIISAGSVVHEDVAPWSLVMGNPAVEVG